MKQQDVRTRAELENAVAEGLEPEFLFFWGHRPSQDGQLTKSCLSQWWMSSFEVDGEQFLTAEHFMMAGKAVSLQNWHDFCREIHLCGPLQ